LCCSRDRSWLLGYGYRCIIVFLEETLAEGRLNVGRDLVRFVVLDRIPPWLKDVDGGDTAGEMNEGGKGLILLVLGFLKMKMFQLFFW
jgi:hypothetical protein